MPLGLCRFKNQTFLLAVEVCLLYKDHRNGIRICLELFES
jgi:hypothetical protein